MQAVILRAQASDLDDLVRLEIDAFPGDRISRRAFRSLIKSPSASVLVRRVSGELAGYAVVLFRKGSQAARLYSLAARSGYAGLGHRLLSEAESEAARRGCAAMRLEVRSDNDRAIRLYQRMGYRFRDSVEHYYNDGATALRFEKHLDAQPGTAAA